jgi:hypothetical protein
LRRASRSIGSGDDFDDFGVSVDVAESVRASLICAAVNGNGGKPFAIPPYILSFIVIITIMVIMVVD